MYPVFADKEGTQEEFFHTFNALYDERKQIVLRAIACLTKSLNSRNGRLTFCWAYRLTSPARLETRIAILRKKANSERLEIRMTPQLYRGANRLQHRELEGALVRVKAYSAIQGTDITPVWQRTP
jgi:chromosomal replication initiator protein